LGFVWSGKKRLTLAGGKIITFGKNKMIREIFKKEKELKNVASYP